MTNEEKIFSKENTQNVLDFLQKSYDKACHTIFCKNRIYKTLYFGINKINQVLDTFKIESGLSDSESFNALLNAKEECEKQLEEILEIERKAPTFIRLKSKFDKNYSDAKLLENQKYKIVKHNQIDYYIFSNLLNKVSDRFKNIRSSMWCPRHIQETTIASRGTYVIDHLFIYKFLSIQGINSRNIEYEIIFCTKLDRLIDNNKWITDCENLLLDKRSNETVTKMLLVEDISNISGTKPNWVESFLLLK